MKGYNGKIARIDLGTGRITFEDLKEEFARAYIGGSGFGAKMLYDLTGPETDPLGPDNVLIFAAGPITGTTGFNSDRFEVIAKSPHTGIYGEASCGGHFGGRFKRCGLDMVIILGRADRPTYIVVEETGIRLESGEELWGQDTFITQRTLKEKEGKTCEVACIGPAGENLLRIAGIITEGSHGRAAARCGLGAVMGSKNLKAVVVAGNGKVETAAPERIKEINLSLRQSMEIDAKAIGEAGTTCALDYFEEIGNLPLRNWYQGKWPEGAAKLTGYATLKAQGLRNYSCGNCPIGCGKVARAKGGPYDGQEVAAPEYETVGMMGSNLLIEDYDAIVKENELCNRYGVDTIAAGNTLALAMECFERGLLSLDDTDGIVLRFGDGQAAIQALEKLCRKEGKLGTLLCDGAAAAAERIGGVAREFAQHVKGLELPAHDPRANFSLALAYSTSNRGACHLSFTQDYEEAKIEHLEIPATEGRFSSNKAAMVARMQDWSCLFDSLCICKFSRYGGLMVEQTLGYLNAATGWDMGFEEFLKAGERIFNIKRMYNVRHGISRKDDTLPPRILTHRRGGGTNELPPLNIMLSDYYSYRGWDELGIPKKEKLRSLGL